MRTDGYGDHGLVVNMHKRALRGMLAVCAFSTYLVGYRVSPGWIFAFSTLSIYLMMSAIIGSGLLSALAGLLGRREPDEPVSMDLNIGGWDRLVRGATALVMMGSVMSGITMMLDTLDYFILMLITFYAGMTAIIAWDPVYALLSLGSRSNPSPAFPLRRSTDVVNLRPYRPLAAKRPAAKSRAA
ncbi:MAG TPA: DUF2892 domain-containing protein [Gammaproteobacteria bacterium]|nr:DUF2892 domain-containing protein [Gammaproteobacteria bacterium]